MMKTVIVTGGTFGIGAGITRGLAHRGWHVVAFGLDAPQVSSTAAGTLQALRNEVQAEGWAADILEADVSSAADVARVLEVALARQGTVHALVHNAAIGPLGTVLDTDEALWDKIFAVNVRGAYLCARAVIPHMARQGGGAIVNIGSGAGWGKPNMAAYAASKGAIHTLSQALAYDHFHQHIRVNTVIPGGGGIITGMSLGRVGGDPAKFGQGAVGSVAGRPVNPDDMANTVAFLLSEDAAAISGTVIDVGCFAHQGGPVPARPAASANR